MKRSQSKLWICMLLKVFAGSLFMTLSCLEACLSDPRCDAYCQRVVDCLLSDPVSCQASCAENLGLQRDPWGESCVLEQTCDDASRCILCDQYCSKLGDCEVSTDSNCISSCDTVLAGGADSEPYQCVVDSSCEDISNCGI